MGPPKKEIDLEPSAKIEGHAAHRDSLSVEELKGGGEERPAKKARVETVVVVDPEADGRCAQLIDMGMDPDLSAKAAALFQEVDQAVEWILDGAPNIDDRAAGQREEQSIAAAEEPEERTTGAVGGQAGFSFLTYNVWFMDGDSFPDVAVEVRMTALAKIIAKADPDVVALQECTAKIVRLLQGDSALKPYSWSPLPRGAPYFTMMLSRGSQSFTRLGFPMTQMGRDLLMTEMSLGFGQRVHVATSHLESAVPPYKGEALMSKQRAQQLKCAAELFTQHGVRNAVYGGDMNWDEKKLDGDPVKILTEASPSGREWHDMWKLLKPASEPGYTYDGKRNDMLLNNMKMRLDRVFATLQDYEPTSIEMVGTAKIPGATYEKDTSRGPRTLPLLPSDHFGLLCVFGRKAGAGGRSLR